MNYNEDQINNYLRAWSKTMVDIWKEKIAMLNVIDTGALDESITDFQVTSKNDQATISHKFLEYGLYQDSGTGRGVSVGNPGDLGHDTNRIKKLWFTPKYYASRMNLKEDLADIYKEKFIGIISSIAKK